MGVAIKVCGFVEPEDVAQAVREDLDAVGVVLDRGPHRVDRAQALELLAAANGSGKEVVAVAGRTTVDAVLNLLHDGFDRVQAVLTPEQLRELPPDASLLPVLFDDEDLVERADRLREAYPFERLPGPRSVLDGLLNLDGKGGGGTGARADRARAAQVASRVPVMLSGGLSAGNVAQAMAEVKPVGVDVSSYTQGSHGRKDLQRIRAFIRAVRSAPSHTLP